MKSIIVKSQKYILLKNYREGFQEEVFQEKYTDYFQNFNYIVGDWSYGKLRLKGFNSKTNPNFKNINDIDKVEEYLNRQCAYECRYFILSKEEKQKEAKE